MRPLLLVLALAPAAAAQVAPPLPPPPEELGEAWCVVLYVPEIVGGPAALQAAAVYPESARADGVAGEVVLEVDVDEDGTVRGVEVVRSPDPRLSAAALAALGRVAFHGRCDAHGVAMPVEVTLAFAPADD